MPLLLLIACTGADPPDSQDSATDSALDRATDTAPPDTAPPPVPQRWHALLSADHQTSKQHPPLVEVGSDLVRTWEQDFNGERGRGAQGIDRHQDGRTVYTRVDGDVESGWIDLLDADGTLSWTWDGAQFGGLHFPHAVVFTPAGDLVIADTSASRLLSVDLDGQLLWEESLPTTSPNGLDLRVDDDGLTHLLVTGRKAMGGDPSDTEELVSRYVLGDRTASPELLWSRSLSGGANAGESPHGPALLDDGTALYCARGRGQIVHLDAAGDELWRSDEDSAVLTQPQDVVAVDDTWLVVDTTAGALLRIADPFGAFTLTDSAPLDGIFGVTLVWCGDDGGLPCLGP